MHVNRVQGIDSVFIDSLLTMNPSFYSPHHQKEDRQRWGQQPYLTPVCGPGDQMEYKLLEMLASCFGIGYAHC